MKNYMFILMLTLVVPFAEEARADTVVYVTQHPAHWIDLRSQQLPQVLGGSFELEDYFSPSFLAAVPATQINALSVQFVAQHGKPLRIIGTIYTGPNSATIKIEYEKSIATAEITVEPGAPNKVVGLLIKGFEQKGDSLAKIDADFAALTGKSGYLIEKIEAEGRRQLIAGRAAAQQFATGSTFKLYILAELASQIEAGQRKWSDVVPLDARAYSSSATQGWPRGTPVTLQTLATWMISVSDNAASDELIRVLGRDAVEQKLASIGHSAPDRALPLLTTVEAFALKSNPALRARFQKASEAQQRDILDNETGALSYDKIDLSQLGSGPVAIDSIEWSASPNDTALLLNHLLRIDSKTALDIMAVNKGIAPATAAKWKYLGYKGGSEPGVIAMSFLAQSKAGDWFAISGAWNNPAKDVDNAAFASLMGRLIDSLAD